MNISISWGNYCLLTALCLFIYYLSFYLIFFVKVFQKSGGGNYIFSKDTFKEFNSQNPATSQTSLFPKNELALSSDDKENKDAITTSVQDFVHEFNSLIQQIQLELFTKEILISRLQQLLKKYHQIKESDYKQSINNLILGECDNRCDIKLTAQEIANLWH